MSTLAEELAVLVVDRDSFTVGDKLEGQNKIDYDETVRHYAVVLACGLNRYASISNRKKTVKICWVCWQPGADTTGIVRHAMPKGLPCPPKEVKMHAECKAGYTKLAGCTGNWICPLCHYTNKRTNKTCQGDIQCNTERDEA